jgi:hypothetical protein
VGATIYQATAVQQPVKGYGMRLKGWLQTRTGRIISGVFLLVGIVGIVLALLWATNTFGWRKWRVIEAQQFIGSVLPSEAQNIQFTTEAEKTRILWLRFTLPSESDLTSFFSEIGLDAALRQDFTPFPAPNPSEAAISWWMPQAAQNYSGLHAIQAGKVYDVLLDQGDITNLIIYLRVYAMGMG